MHRMLIVTRSTGFTRHCSVPHYTSNDVKNDSESVKKWPETKL